MPDWLPMVSAITGPAILGIIIWTSIVRPIRARRAGGKRQQAVDHLSQQLSDAIHDLMNRNPPVASEQDLDKWKDDYREWGNKVSDYLGEHFSKSEQDHFNRIGLVQEIQFGFAYNKHHNHMLRQLGIKFDRLRDIIRDNQFRE